MTRTWIGRGEPFADLFATWQTSVFRWECQGQYHEPEEDEPFERWRRGIGDNEWIQPWAAQIRTWRRAGKTFNRVRMLTEPLTEYLRWMLDVTSVNVDAGEDIRWIGERTAREMGAPTYDFYLFDNARVVILHFDERGVSGADLIDDADVVREHQAWRDRVWPMAIPHHEYISQHQRSP